MIAIVLGLVVLTAALTLVPQIQDGHKVRALVREVSAIRSHMEKLFPPGSGARYTDYGITQLDDVLRPLLNPGWRGDSATNYLGSPISGVRLVVAPAAWSSWSGSGAPVLGDSYIIYVYNIPSEICLSAARQMAGLVDYVGINGSQVYRNPDLPFDSQAAIVACNNIFPKTLILVST